MAGLCCLKILLLWAGIIGLANCQNNTDNSTPLPPHTTTNPTSPSVTTLSASTPRTMTEAPVMSSVTQTTAHTPPLTSQTPTSESLTKALSSNTTSASPLPANTSSSPTNTSTSKEPDSQTNQTHNATSPTTTPTTAPNTTVITTIPASTPAPPPQCDYTVAPIKFGLKITLTTGSTAGNYIIQITEEGRLVNKTTINHQDSNQTSSHDIKQLKPCTAYEHSVGFIDSTGNPTTCNSTGNETITTPGMNEPDIKDVSCIPGYVCYQSEWDISSSFSTPNYNPAETCKSDSICIKPGYNDICSDLTTTFTSGNCVNDSSFIKTKSISVDFFNPSEINQKPPTGLPAEIKPTLPPNCGLTVNYTCQENGNPSDTKQLSELEPFTDYSCTGQIKDISDVIVTDTPAINVNIKCEIKITNKNTIATNTSIDLSWTTTSENCKDLPNLQKLSYHCSCGTKHSDQRQDGVNKHPQGGTCYFTGLEPYTDYTCKVQPTYNNEDVGRPTEIRQKTDIGVPREVTNLKVDLVEHNVIKVTCHCVKDLKGPDEKYTACLNDCNDKNLKQERNKCDFEFKDLSYLTTYKVKVTVFNGRWESKPVIKDIDTLTNDDYNLTLFIRRLSVFAGIITCVALAVVGYKIYVLRHTKYR